MSEREVYLSPDPTAGWLTLKLGTAGCQIFVKFHTAGSLSSCLMCLLLYQSSG